MIPVKKPTTWKDKALFTPGPLTTSRTVKQAMLRDLGSRDFEFIEMVKNIRSHLVALGGSDASEHTSVIMQGSGTFGIESVISSVIPPEGKLLVIVNGAYGKRMVKIASMLKIACETVEAAEDSIPDLAEIERLLAADATITLVAIVHCETTTGIFNPIQAIGKIVKQHSRQYFVDAMSSFGAVDINLAACGIDYLVSSANKCIEGVPGFSFVIARRSALVGSRGFARSLSLDLLAQAEELDRSGQFRFTPPTHALLAFHQALIELAEEGGVAGRAARYQENFTVIMDGMRKMGFQPYLNPQNRGYIITSFLYPNHPNFNFAQFYEKLNLKGFVIYPGKLSTVDCFRIGHVGRIDPVDSRGLLAAIAETLVEMGISLAS